MHRYTMWWMTWRDHTVLAPTPRDVNISDDPLSASAAADASALFHSQPPPKLDLGPLSPSAAATPPPQAGLRNDHRHVIRRTSFNPRSLNYTASYTWLRVLHLSVS